MTHAAESSRLGNSFTSARAAWFTQEFRTSYAWLKARLQRRVGSPADAEDLASSSFVELAALDDFSTVREPRALLTVIAQRLMFDMWRRRDLERAYLESLGTVESALVASTEVIAEIAEAISLVDDALKGLSGNCRSAFIYSQVDGLTYAQIAEKLEVSVSMVRKYLAQALTRCYGAQ
jgi:RNA polymerase sigma-19 factor, ECF subfamily